MAAGARRQLVWRAPLEIAETFGSIKRLWVAGKPDRASSKPMVEGSNRQHRILGVAIGEQRDRQAARTPRPSDFEASDHGAHCSLAVPVVTTRQLGHQRAFTG